MFLESKSCIDLKLNNASSFNNNIDTIDPVAALIIKGVKAVMLISAKTTSIANKTPAIGALKAAAIPAATPQA